MPVKVTAIEYLLVPDKMRDDGKPFERTVLTRKGRVVPWSGNASAFHEVTPQLSECRMMLPIIE